MSRIDDKADLARRGAACRSTLSSLKGALRGVDEGAHGATASLATGLPAWWERLV